MHIVVTPIARELRSSGATRPAVLMGKNVSYIKGKRMMHYLRVDKSMTEEQAEEVGKSLLRDGLVYRADKDDAKTRTLRPSESQDFDSSGFYVWRFDGSTTKKKMLLGAIVMGLLVAVTMPIWPERIRICVWYASVTAFSTMLGVCLARFVLFFVLYAVGVDFWILPNLLVDESQLHTVFRPLFSVSFSGTTSWPYRAAAATCVLATALWIAAQPTEFDEFVASNRAFMNDLYDGSLLAETSQKKKDMIDAVFSAESLERELYEIENA